MTGRRGTVGTSMSVVRVKCRHKWTPWTRAGMLDATERRSCAWCGRIQTRPGRQTATDRAETPSSTTDLPRRRSTLPVTKREAKRQAAIRAARAAERPLMPPTKREQERQGRVYAAQRRARQAARAESPSSTTPA